LRALLTPLRTKQIIAPGSQTTLAQLGLPESYTPAKVRVPTRMFPTETNAQWEPHKIRQKKVSRSDGPDKAKSKDTNGDTEMGDEPEKDAEKEEDEVLYEEDLRSDEGAVYPLQNGSITDLPCLLALLTHVYKTLNPPFNAPILLVAQPAWTIKDHEELTMFFFETFKPPAFCLIDSALAVSYAYGVSTATVVDVGFEKSDVTAISDYTTQTVGRGIAVPKCGGDAMTSRLFELLEPKGWTKAMCEQLKKSSICEILPQGTPLPGTAETESQVNPAAVASTGSGQRKDPPAPVEVPRGPDPAADAVEEEVQINESEDGVLDVASLVASGKMKEYLAQKEKEKATKAADKAADKAAKKAAADSAAAIARAGKLPNSRREKNIFNFEERRTEEKAENGTRPTETESTKRQKTPDHDEEANAEEPDGESESTRRQHEKAARKEERRIKKQVQSGIIRRELDVGIERFRATSGGNIEILADTIYRTVLAVQDPRKRSDLWDSLIIVGNGARVKGKLLLFHQLN
jgi:actin-related protein 9